MTMLTSLYEIETRSVATERNLHITGGVKQSHQLRFSRVVIVVVRVVVGEGVWGWGVGNMVNLHSTTRHGCTKW